MPRSRDYLLPSILQVLENGCWHRQYSEGCSSVIVWVDPALPKHKKAKKRAQTPLSDLLRTIDLRDRDDGLDEGAERFSHIVYFPDDNSDQEHSDSDTIFRTRPSRTSASNSIVSFLDSTKAKLSAMKIAIQNFFSTNRID